MSQHSTIRPGGTPLVSRLILTFALIVVVVACSIIAACLYNPPTGQVVRGGKTIIIQVGK